MLSKPFRSPLLVKKVTSTTSVDHEPLTKKRRISENGEIKEEQSGPQLVFKAPGISSLPRKPLIAVRNLAKAVETTKPPGDGIDDYYRVLWLVADEAQRDVLGNVNQC